MVKDLESLREMMAKVKAAQAKFAEYSQEEVDRIFKEVALVINNERINLAKMAVEETGMGILEDKVIKNHFASEYIYNKYKDEKTCGVLEEDRSFGIKKIATPIGVVAGVIPTTNPTSTTAFKTLLALKTRNGIIFSPHPRAKGCTIYTAKLALEAAVKAGAPENIIGWIDEPSVDLSKELMAEADLILATGGPGMVKAAYSSGKPAIGVGAGNTPVIVDETADVKMTVNYTLMSKTFDNGVICASEQAVIVDEKIYDEVKKEFDLRGAYILKKTEIDKVRNTIFVDGALNSKIVGQSAYTIAKMAGVEVPENAKVLIGEVTSVSDEEPFAHEKLSPVLAMYKAKNYDDALDKAAKLIDLGGLGHTSLLYVNLAEREKVDKFGKRMKTGRTLVNMPSSLGAIGDVFNFKLEPSLTLGCGSWGGNSVSENVGVKHLINIKTVAERRENMLWFRVPEKIYFKFGSLPVALEELKGSKKRAFIVTDSALAKLGFTNHITKVLDELNIDYRIFSDVVEDPTLSSAQKGAQAMLDYNPDVIIALGGGSAMDAAKIMWVLYEHPEVKFHDLSMRFMDIRKRIYAFPKMGVKAEFIAVATSAGTGSEVTPFSVITDDETGVKYPLADYELTPDVAIIDPELMLTMPKGLTVASGIDVLTHAVESYVSTLATEYTKPISLEAMRLVFDFLPESVDGGAKAINAKEKMANASCLAGMAFANAFLGICHSMAHKLGGKFHVPHGIANAMLLNEVIKFNAVESPTKMGVFPQYKYPDAKNRYVEIANFLGISGKTDDDKITNLIKAIDELKAKIGIPASIKEYGIAEKDFLEAVDQLALDAFDDQCTGANPRYPLVTELKEVYLKAYYGADYKGK
ncbi:bifunctional acetaldehyde-CoA/alcohol dehydrogenase [Sebaldella sp. S0638]|uniref:bifunctional acetaldehyde-CoA/alcohol dehydrogenase n=1 Tax=Sebaldella sp. S0638 TaxID=2957809 RepID=UPI00209D2AC4|nr:bifunctional acetaldehyde-CoA/alcohol dehydrogenase [Sebaldella sp. S0638]MCP1225821.1 bifunctional acetaldehyde-CoA/alcohol dehydrogenase [Sebaldella sp. S0638]